MGLIKHFLSLYNVHVCMYINKSISSINSSQRKLSSRGSCRAMLSTNPIAIATRPQGVNIISKVVNPPNGCYAQYIRGSILSLPLYILLILTMTKFMLLHIRVRASVVHHIIHCTCCCRSRDLEEQAEEYEVMYGQRMKLLQQSVKKANSRKRRRQDDGERIIKSKTLLFFTVIGFDVLWNISLCA